MSDFKSEATGALRKAGMALGAQQGAQLGVAASASVYSTALATGTVVFAPPGLLCLGLVVGLPVAGAYLGWKAVKLVTDAIDG